METGCRSGGSLAAAIAVTLGASGAVAQEDAGRVRGAGEQVAARREPGPVPAERFASGRVLVRLAVGVTPGRAGGTLGLPEADVVLAGAGAGGASPVFRRAPADAAAAGRLGLDRWHVVTLAAGADAGAVAGALRLCPGIEGAEPDGLGGPATPPDDPRFADQWPLANTGANGPVGGVVGADIDALVGWAASSQSRTVTLAVIDTGVDHLHPDLASIMIPGWNVLTNSETGTRDDGCPHGTLIAGVAAALTNNGAGIAGICWNARVMPVKVLHGCGGTESDCAAGIVWAADHGAEVANMSLQYFGGTAVLRDAVTYAAERGVVLVCAAGNFAQAGFVAWPARFPECIAVSATTNQDAIAHFSNTGPEVDISAPGADVLSTAFGGLYQPASGTSLAAPQVAGAAMVLRSIAPGLTAEDVFKALREGVDDLGPPGHDPQFGMGRLNLLRAVEAAVVSCYANCDGSVVAPVLNVADFSCFLTRFAAGEAWANCDGSVEAPVLNAADFACFLGRYAAGCGR